MVLGTILSSQLTKNEDGYIYLVWHAAYVLFDRQVDPEEATYNSRSERITFVRAPTAAVAAPKPASRGTEKHASVPEPFAVRRSQRKLVIQGFHCICLCYITFCIRWRRKNPIPQQNVQKGKAMAFYHLILKPRLQQNNR